MRKSNKATSAKLAASTANVPALVPANAPTVDVIDPASLATGVTIDNATGETVSPATEAKPDPRVARAERIAADREAVSKLYSAFEAQRLSIPVKPLSAFKLAKSTAHPIARNPSTRQAAAIAVALAAAGVKLIDGAKAKRVFEIDGKPCAIENGVLRDAISSGLVRVSGTSPESEIITVANKAAATISGMLGATLLKAAGLTA